MLDGQFNNAIRVQERPDVQRCADAAMVEVEPGQANYEVGTVFDKNGKPIHFDTGAGDLRQPDQSSGMRIHINPTEFADANVHNQYGQPGPSPADVDVAKRSHKRLYVLSEGGLFAVDPAGNVTHPYTNVNDATSKKKKASVK